jgi:putative FmdB family regulatory protein
MAPATNGLFISYDSWNHEGGVREQRPAGFCGAHEPSNIGATRTKGDQMPTYEYKCLDCGKESELYLSITEHDGGKITCPECKSTRMEQLMSAISAKTSRKS